MKKLVLIFALLLKLPAHAIAQTQPYGIIDTADLKMTACDFEKDANAEVLFDKAEVNYVSENIVMQRHKRIKIFNDKGKDEANVRIEYYSLGSIEEIENVQAQTINLDGKTIAYTAIDKKQIYTEKIDKERKAIVFSFPNVKSGSVIEFEYKLTAYNPYDYPDWFFQADIPTRYSEFSADFLDYYRFKLLKNIYQPVVKDSATIRNDPNGVKRVWALSNVKSYPHETYMDYPDGYEQCILPHRSTWDITWGFAVNTLLMDEDFGWQLNKKLNNEAPIIAKANLFKTPDDKIAFLFDTVKKTMKWDKTDRWYTIDGVKKAWDKKTGNSTEINLILYNLLKSANLNPQMMEVSTRDHGQFILDYPSLSQLNKAVVYIPLDSAKYYVLDASSPYNSYNNIPYDLMGLNALSFDPVNKMFKILPIKDGHSKEIILTTGNIDQAGKLEGTSQISSFSYDRVKHLRAYNDLGEKKYSDQLQSEHNGLKITALKMENIENDTLPLIQTIHFNYNLTAPDGDYMYFNPGQFSGFENNPFLSETRVSNIYLGSLNNYSIFGRYNIPDGYKIDALPRSADMQMPDKSISFRRVVAAENSEIMVRYIIDFKRALFEADEYPSIRDFYKKMYEMLNEQIVLKKQDK